MPNTLPDLCICGCPVGYKIRHEGCRLCRHNFSLCQTIHPVQDLNNLGSHPLNSGSTPNHWGNQNYPCKLPKRTQGWTFLIESHYYKIGLNIAFIHIFALQLMDLSVQYCTI